MIDVEKQITYWRDGSNEDWEVACELVDAGRTRHGLFFARLSFEKMLKAHVCRVTKELAPKIHSLPRLAALSKLSCTEPQLAFLYKFDQHQLEGRYPEHLPIPPEKSVAKREMEKAEEMLKWLKRQF